MSTEVKQSTSPRAHHDDIPEGESKLHNKYTLWYYRRSNQNKATNIGYEESIRKIDSFHTVEHFWRVYNHVQRPNDIKHTTDFHMFKDGIKPMWEDSMNREGGKCMVKVKKGLTSMYWEDLLLAMIGEQFDVGQEICGAVVSIRGEHDIISVWNKSSNNLEATNKIRDQIRRILKLPSFVPVEYKKHEECLTDQSSYRNPTTVWKPAHLPNSHHQGHSRSNSDSTSPRSGSFVKQYNNTDRDGHTQGEGGHGNKKWNNPKHHGDGAGPSRSSSAGVEGGAPVSGSSPRGNWRAAKDANKDNNNSNQHNISINNNHNNNINSSSSDTGHHASQQPESSHSGRVNIGNLVRDQLAALGGH